MPLLSKLVSFWHTVFCKARLEQELDEEARSYVEMLTDEKVEAGATREEARRAALIEFGGLDQVKEQVREVQVGVFLETFWQDLRYAARALAKSPGFTAVALLSLTLGIGLNTAIFSTINAVLLRPLPYKDPQRLVRVEQTTLRYRDGKEPAGVPPANYLDWKEQNTVFEAMAIYERIYGGFTMVTEAKTAQIQGQRVSASFFPLLGVQPALGRTFLDEEDKPGANVAVLSHGLWQRHFDSDPNVVGRDITLNQASYRVIGVMPEGFRYFLEYGFTPQERATRVVDLWLPYPFENNPPTNRQQYGLSAIARLKRTVTLKQAQVEMKMIAQRLEQEYPKENKGSGIWLAPLHEDVLGQTRSPLKLVWGAAGLVLLIACVNVGNLLLARAGARKGEITIRSAIGASRQRLVRQLLTESFLLALMGGAGGLVVAGMATNLLNSILPARVARFGEASLDLRVLAFALVATLVTGVLFGLVPALHGSKVQISSALTEDGRGALRGRAGMRLQRILVPLQMGLSLVLLAGAGLMVNSFWRLHQIHLGFNPDNLLVLRCVRLMVPPVVTELGVKEIAGGTKAVHVALNPEAMRFPEHVVERLQTLLGVESAAVAYAFPMVRTVGGYRFKIEGRPEPSPQEAEKMGAQEFPISPGYFRTLGIRLLRGRDFNHRDTQNALGVVIINQAMARGFWPDEVNAIGKRITWGDPKQTAEIVGVVEDVRSWAKQPSGPHIYVPLSQSWSRSHPYPSFYLWKWRFLTFAIRAASDPAAVATAARNTVKEVDKSQPVEWIRTMDEVISGEFEPWRATMLLLGLFAGLAVLLSALGIYGVISYAVTQRTHEIGVRMALGARSSDVLTLVMKGGLVLTLVGIVLGSVAAYWLTRLISSHLFEVKPTDPLTFVCVALVLMSVAMVACYLPARRAAHQDPTVALRCK